MLRPESIMALLRAESLPEAVPRPDARLRWLPADWLLRAELHTLERADVYSDMAG
jgi:hypothetical protein